MHTTRPRRITRQYPGDTKPWTLTVWDVHNPAGTVVDSYNRKRDAAKSAVHHDEMTALLALAARKAS